MTKAKILVIGDENIVFGFTLLGIEGRIVHHAEEAQRVLDQAVAEQEAEIILVTSQWADALRVRMDAIMTASLRPIVLPVPSGAPGELEQADLGAVLRHALGVHLGA